MFITTDKDDLAYINYYQGLTLSKTPDALVEVPKGRKTYDYTFKYKTLGENNALILQQVPVTLSFAGDCVYIKGMCIYQPEAWIQGKWVNGQLVLDLPQYVGDYTDAEQGVSYPVYLNGFDPDIYLLNRQVTIGYDPQTQVFSGQSTPMGFGINKTGYLNVQDIYEAVLEPVKSFLIGDVNDDGHVNISDVTDLINDRLKGNASAINLAAADADGDGNCNISDVTTLINYLLRH